MLRSSKVKLEYGMLWLAGLTHQARCWGFVGHSTKTTEGASMHVWLRQIGYSGVCIQMNMTDGDLLEHDNTSDFPCLQWLSGWDKWVRASVDMQYGEDEQHIEGNSWGSCRRFRNGTLGPCKYFNVVADVRAKGWSLQWSQPSVASPWPGVRGWWPT